MAALDDLAATFFGGRRAETNSVLTDGTTHTYVGTATSDSQDGHVMVELSGDVTNPEPVEIDGETYYSDADTSVELPTTTSVQEGDEVLVSVYGGTPLRSPVVTGVVGSGDRVAGMAQDAYNLADSVEGIAQQALDVANATGQHFWSDTDGAHVTEVTQEEWTDPTSTDYQSGPNSLWNSLGMLFRDGLNNLLAVLTSGLAIYDGLGNTEEHILAEFGPAKVRLGGKVDNGAASVEFFDTTGVENVLKSEIDVSNHFVNTEFQLSSTTTDEALDASGEVHALGDVRVSQFASNDGTTPYGGSLAVLSASAYDSLADDTKKAWVSASAKSDGGGEGGSLISLYAETLHLNNFLRGEDYTMEQAISAIPVTLFTGTYSHTVSSTVYLSESAANFSRLRIEWEAGDGYRGSTELSNPDGARFMCSGMVSGSGTNPVTYVTWKIYEVVGTRISNWQRSGNYQRGQINIYNSGNPTTNRNELIGITKVLGWR